MTQHYLFAHSILPGLFWSDRGALKQRLETLYGRAFLTKLWTHAGLHAAQNGLQSLEAAGGPTLEMHEMRFGPLFLVTMPPPREALEGYFLAMVWSQQPAYFVLERGDDEQTHLCGWRQGEHVDYGPGPEPTAEAFLAALDASAR